jgi:Protein of unknown function (DUF1153)
MNAAFRARCSRPTQGLMTAASGRTSERVFSVQMRQRVNWVRGPDGDTLTRNDMPSPNTRRWGLRLKARVVAGVEGGLITLAEACAWYDLSAEEYVIWRRRTLQREYPDLSWIQDAPREKPTT